MAEIEGTPPPHVLTGIQYFNQGLYFEAHEELEQAWRDEPGAIRDLYRGILQIGVAYYHLLRGNYSGCKKMFERAKKCLAPFSGICLGIDITQLKRDALEVEMQVLRGSNDQPHAIHPDYLKPILLISHPSLENKMAIDYPFLNKIALVTGSGRGIGKAIALQFARLGADVVINYHRNQKPAEETAELIRAMGRKAVVIQANVAKPEDIDQLFAEIEIQLGGLDFFVNNAASGFNRPAMQQRVNGWDWTMNTNARAFLFAAQKAVPLMQQRGGGAIVAISSPGSTRVLPDYVAVGASKAALESLVRYLAVELSPQIIVNAVAPGVVETDALKHFAALSNPEVITKAVANTPAGRLATPEDVAQVVTFLCSPAAWMIRGQVIVMDGGMTLLTPR